MEFQDTRLIFKTSIVFYTIGISQNNELKKQYHLYHQKEYNKKE